MTRFWIKIFVRYLIDNGVDLDIGPNPALHLALRKKYSAIALLLIQAGAEFEVKDQVIYYMNLNFKNWIEYKYTIFSMVIIQFI